MKKFAAVCIAVSMLYSASAALAVDESTVTAIARGTSRADIHAQIGDSAKQSMGGYKEIYRLSNGSDAVLSFDEDILSCGFIVLN